MDTPRVISDTTLRSYEFDDQENGCLNQLGNSMRHVGILDAGVGGLLFLYAYPLTRNSSDAPGTTMLALTLTAVLLTIKGIHLWRAGDYFRKVVRTRGSDITNLMVALNDLREAYDFHWWAPLVVMLVLLASTIAALR